MRAKKMKTFMCLLLSTVLTISSEYSTVSASNVTSSLGNTLSAAKKTTTSKKTTKKTSKQKEIEKALVLSKRNGAFVKGQDRAFKTSLPERYYERDFKEAYICNTSGLPGPFRLRPTERRVKTYDVYEFTERPKYAGKPKTITLSDKDLLPENLLKKGIQVGDTIITKSFTYEQDGNEENGKEPIEWIVQKIQYCHLIYEPRVYRMKAFNPYGSNLTASYYMVAKKTLDYDEYFKVTDYTSKLYTGEALLNQKVSDKQMKLCDKKKFVYDPLHGIDIDFSLIDYFWNTRVTSAYVGYMSLYKFDNKDTKSKPTAYALSKGIPTNKKGYVEKNWIYGFVPYYFECKDKDRAIAFRGLAVSPKNTLTFNGTYGDKAGYRPEMTLVTGVNTSKDGNFETPYTYKECYEELKWVNKLMVNKEVWKSLSDFVKWE